MPGMKKNKSAPLAGEKVKGGRIRSTIDSGPQFIMGPSQRRLIGGTKVVNRRMYDVSSDALVKPRTKKPVKKSAIDFGNR